MEKSIKIFSLLVLLATAAFANAKGDLESEKIKAYSKSYPVGSNDKIVLENKFGEMQISTWTKNEIRVDVLITVKARSDERAQKLLDVISIEDGKTGSDIFFKTSIKQNNRSDNDDNEGGSNGENSSFRINYTVHLPSGTTLDASNMFGDMSITDFDGPLNLSSKFGSLTAGKLSQPKKVLVQFGKKVSVFESVNGGKLSIQFSQALVNKISGDISLDFNQSHGVKIKLDNSLKKLDINNNFSEVLIDAPKNLSASFKINTSFGKFSNESSFTVNRNGDDDDRYSFRNYTYSGKAGTGAVPINIKSNFGSITLGHDLAFDPVSLSKSKDKGKSKM